MKLLPHYSPSARTRSLVTKAYLRHLASSSKPIVCGPFRSELGFECLYWLPFLQWACHTYGLAKDRCLAVSRGGMGMFYPAARQCDLYALRSVDEVRIENQVDWESRKLQKQLSVTAWDRKVIADAAKEAGITGYHLLHPSWMYWLFEPIWNEQATLRHVLNHARYDAMPVPNLPEGLTLPEKFVAVRFYERNTLPVSHPEIRELITNMVTNLAARVPVVLLNQPQVFADDHVDLPLSGPNIVSLPSCAPAQNFLLQASVLARAQAFVGTYGGVAQWALRYGKPTMAFYSAFNQTAYAHRTLSGMLSAAMNVPFQMCDLRAMKLWEAALTKMVVDTPRAESSTKAFSVKELANASV